jgi:hypothetical protein
MLITDCFEAAKASLCKLHRWYQAEILPCISVKEMKAAEGAYQGSPLHVLVI